MLGLSHTIYAQVQALGDIPLDSVTYQRYLRILEIKALPASYDARDDGIVTSAKDQGACGSCWSFASVGAFESHLLKDFSVGPTDLSEQQQVSCNLSMSGCCGGSSTAIRWWETRGAIYETCFPYGESSTSCPTQRTVPCGDASGCEQLAYRVENFHTISDNPTQMKTSLYNDGPSYWRFDVYSDFSSFWGSGSPGEVYVNAAATSKRGGHAVLLIGWSDSKGAYLCKNSWGATGGPQGDGTFWIAYTGHAHNLGFQMANFDLALWEGAYKSLFKTQADLELFREYRDKVLITSGQGKEYTDLLYKHSEAALSVLLNHRYLLGQAQKLIEANKGAVAQVLDGNAGVINDTDEVISFLAAYARKAPTPLKVLAHLVIKEMQEKQQQNELFLGFRLK
jgi:hypothetical protein